MVSHERGTLDGFLVSKTLWEIECSVALGSIKGNMIETRQ